MYGGPQPEYSDGTAAWAVEAIRVGSKPQTLRTRYVRAADRETACQIGDEVMPRRGLPRHALQARPAGARELGMVPMEETA